MSSGKRHIKSTCSSKPSKLPRMLHYAFNAAQGMDMDLDGETTNAVVELLKELGNICWTSVPPPSVPPPPLSSHPSPLGYNPLVMNLGYDLLALDTGSFAQEFMDPFDGWSRYAVQVLCAVLCPLGDKSPNIKVARAPEALSHVDAFAAQVEASIWWPCPTSCKPPPPPKPKVADKSVSTDPAANPPMPARPVPQAPSPTSQGSACTPARTHTQAAQPPQPPASTVHTLKHPLPSKPAALSPDVPI
ncbi:hypothetical protein FRC11_009312 [Ceratobasidium sp. 423]|nr:hypothetical protein FRC11_009312 [Ceratobasidium sp. 423]